MNYKPYLRFHVDETQFDGRNWLIAFTPRGIDWEPKQLRSVPDEEMRRIWKSEGAPVALDEQSAKRYWAQIEDRVRDYLIREYWALEKKK